MKFNALLESEQISEVMARIFKVNLNVNIWGCVSCLDDADNIWIIPANNHSPYYSSDDIVCVSREIDNETPMNLSEFYPLHKALYEANPKIRAICQLASPSIQVLNDKYNYHILNLLPNLYKKAGTVSILPAADLTKRSNINELSKIFSEENLSVVLRSTGYLCTGTNLQDAFGKAELLEIINSAYLNAKKIGEPRVISSLQIQNAKDNLTNEVVSLRGRRGNQDWDQQKNELLALVQAACALKACSSLSGSFSVRIDENSFLINPNNIDRNYISSGELVFVKNGKVEAGKQPEDRFMIHQKIYEKYSEINCLAIVILPGMLALSITKDFPDLGLSENLLNDFDKIKAVEYVHVFEDDFLADEIGNQKGGLLVKHDFLILTAKSVNELIGKLDNYSFLSFVNLESQIYKNLNGILE